MDSLDFNYSFCPLQTVLIQLKYSGVKVFNEEAKKVKISGNDGRD